MVEAIATREVDSAGFQTLVFPQIRDSASCAVCGGGSIQVKFASRDWPINVSTSGIYKCQVTPAGNGRTHVPEVDGVGEVEGGDDANVALEGVPPLHHEVPGAVLFWGSYVSVCLVVKGKRSNKPAGGECMIHSKALAGTDRSEGIMEPLSARLSPTAKSQMSTLSCACVHGGVMVKTRSVRESTRRRRLPYTHAQSTGDTMLFPCMYIRGKKLSENVPGPPPRPPGGSCPSPPTPAGRARAVEGGRGHVHTMMIIDEHGSPIPQGTHT